jgi:hypothetical protein
MATEKPFLCYRELLPPNNVACATFFAGSDSGSEYLLTASVSVIRVYKVCRRDSIGEDGFDAHLHNSVRPHLSLRAVVPIYARPFDVKVFASGDHHNIILSCDEGKILCLRFNEQIDTLYEHALINVEENAFGVGAEVKINSGANMLPGTGKEPYLAVDEDKKLVCACVYADKLVFIPFNKKIVEPSIIVDTESTSTTTPTPTTSSSIPRFVINMLEDLLLPGAVIDFAFMSGYAQPTLAVLQEQPMPVGHAAQSMHTCTLTVLTVDVYQQSCSILWQRKHLPHDSVRIVCIHIKDHAGSRNGHRKDRGFGLEHTVFVVSMNALIACSFDGVCAIATNGFASITVHQSILNGNTNPVVTAAAAAASSGGRNAVGAIQNWSMPEGVELDASRWCVLANTDSGEEDNMYTLVSALKDGKLIAWHLHTHNNATTINNFQVKFEVELLGSSVCASVLCTNALSSKLHNSNDLLFVGSSFADSLLMYVNRRRRRASSLELSSLYSSGNLWSAMYTHNTTSTVASAASGGATPGTPGPGTFVRQNSTNTPGTNSAATPGTGGASTPATGKRTKRGTKSATLLRSDSAMNKEQSAAELAAANAANAANTQLMLVANNMHDIVAEEQSLYGEEQRKPIHSYAALVQGSHLDGLENGNGHSQASYGKYFSVEIVDSLQSLGPINAGLFTAHDDVIDQITHLSLPSSQQSSSASSSAAGTLSSAQLATGLAGTNKQLQSSANINTQSTAASAYIAPREAKETLLVSSSCGQTSTLSKISNGVSVQKIITREFANANNVVCLPVSKHIIAPSMESSDSRHIVECNCSLLMLGFTGKCRVFLCIEQPQPQQANTQTSSSELILKELPAETSGFVHTDSLIAAGIVSDGGESLVYVQVFSGGLRLVQVQLTHTAEEGDSMPAIMCAALQDVLVSDDMDMGGLGCTHTQRIVSADICGNKCVVCVNTQDLFVLEFDASEQMLKIVHSAHFPDDDDVENGNGREEAHGDHKQQSQGSLQSVLSARPVCATLYHGRFPSVQSKQPHTQASVPRQEDTSTMKVDLFGTGTGTPRLSRSSSLSVHMNREDEFLYGDDNTDEDHGITQAIAVVGAKPTQPADEGTDIIRKAKGKGRASARKQRTNTNSEDHTHDEVATGSANAMDVDRYTNTQGVSSPMIDQPPAHKRARIVDPTPTKQVTTLFNTRTDAHHQDGEGAAPDWDSYYLVVCDVDECVSIIRLHGAIAGEEQSDRTCECVFASTQITQQVDLVPICCGQSSTARANTNSNVYAGIERYVCDVMLTTVGPANTHEHAHGSKHTNTYFHDNDELSRLCLTVLFDTGETCVYYLTGNGGYKSSHAHSQAHTHNANFVKLEYHSVCSYVHPKMRVSKPYSKRHHHHHRNQVQPQQGGAVMQRSNSLDTAMSVDTPTTPYTPVATLSARNNTHTDANNTNTSISTLAHRLQRTHNLYGQTGVLIPGSCPCVLTTFKGFPHLSTISLPELPFSNYGRYFVAPLSIVRNISTMPANKQTHSNSVCAGIEGICTLWQELASVSTQPPPPLPPQFALAGQPPPPPPFQQQSSNVKCLFGLYQQPALVTASTARAKASSTHTRVADSAITSKRVCTHATMRFVQELLPRSDDKTELALLQKKIYVCCSESTENGVFLPQVLTDKETELEEQLYDRFFNNLTSFKQPIPPVPGSSTGDGASGANSSEQALADAADSNVQSPLYGPLPAVTHQQHKVCLFTSGSVVDEYVLPLNECVLALEVVYLTLEKKPDASVAHAVNMAIGRNIVTSDFIKRVFVCACTHVLDKHGEDTQGEGRLLLFSLDYKVDAPVEGASSDHAQFLQTISPKLRLQWQGPGPASVCKQFGENILSTVGASVYIYKLNPDTLCLEQISFYFGQVNIRIVGECIHSLILLM